MSAQSLGSRAIIGEFYKTLQMDQSGGWVDAVSMMFQSDQDAETYKWLGQIPQMREWIGGRQAQGFSDQGVTLTNVHYESTLEVLKRELRRDKTGQLLVRIREQAQRANAHWGKLLSTLIVNGTSTAAADGQFFFDTDHTFGRNTSNQSNDISADISAYPTAVAGTTTVPSVEEMQFAISDGIQSIISFTDNENEPMNEDATDFLVMVPTSLWPYASRAVAVPGSGGGFASQSDVDFANFNIGAVANARLDSSWTDSFAIFRTDANVKAFIRQEETPIQATSLAEGSSHEFQNDAHLYGLDTWRTTGYGMWQMACYVTLA